MAKQLLTSKFVRFLNLMYYFTYRFICVVGGYLDAFTHFTLKPVRWLMVQLPFVRNRYIKLHGSVEEANKVIDNACKYVMNNKEYGYNITFAAMFYGGAMLLYVWGACFVLCSYRPGLLTLFNKHTYSFMFLFVAISGLITYPNSYKKDIYLRYFKEFDKIKGKKRLMYKALTFVVIAGSFVFWIWAMTFSSVK